MPIYMTGTKQHCKPDHPTHLEPAMTKIPEQKLLEQELKTLIIDTMGLEDIGPQDIDSAAPLFGDGLGLDSVDALELGLALQQRYGITIDPETRNMHEHFSSIAKLAAFVASARAGASVTALANNQ